jgi:hypothetical protein
MRGMLGMLALMRVRRTVFTLYVAVAMCAACVVPAVAAAAPPATLTGETLSTAGMIVVACAPPSESGPFSLTVSGPAMGPYPGTFTETATGTVDGATNSFTAFSASFTIHSAAGTVTGTKSGSGGFGCQGTSGDTGGILSEIPYQATISTPTGNYTDQGTSDIAFVTEPSMPVPFGEGFASALSQPTPISPTSKDQCKHGGWTDYPQFKNQGDCVSYVATKGKNPPGGS